MAISQTAGAVNAAPLPADASTIDGGFWLRAQKHETFWLYQPYDGASAPLRTTVQVGCSEAVLIFHIEAFGAGSNGVRASQVRRDQVWDDQDNVTILVDAAGEGASARFFKVSASGSLADGIYTGLSNKMDLQPDYPVDIDASVHTDGYAIDVRIPRGVLKAQGNAGGQLGLQVLRNVPGLTRQVFSGSPLAVNTTNLLSSVVPLGLAECSRQPHESSGGVVLVENSARKRSSDGNNASERDTKLGGYFRWNNGSRWAAHVTYQPDFSQVELDIPQLQSNTRYAINLPEKRDFFLEDADILELPTKSSLNEGGGGQAIYTRTITDPRWGGRLSYRDRGTDFALLSVRDNGGGVVAIPGAFNSAFSLQPASTVAINRGATVIDDWRVGYVLAHRRYDEGLGQNSVGGFDMGWQPDAVSNGRVMALGSRTTARANGDALIRSDSQPGTFLFADFMRNGDKWETSWAYERVSERYRDDVGYAPQSDFSQLSGLITRRWRPQGRVNNIGASLKVIGSETLSTDEAIMERVAPGVWFGGTYDLDLLIEYHPLERRRIAYGSTLHRFDQWYLRFGANIGRYLPAFTLNLSVGDQIDYGLDRVGRGYSASLTGRLRPLSWLEVQPTVSRFEVNHEQLGRTNHELTAQLVVNASIRQGWFIRYIGQYTRGDEKIRGDFIDPEGSMTEAPPFGGLLFYRRGNLHSLVYSMDFGRHYGLDLGITRSRARALAAPRTYETNAFIKVEANW